MVDYQDISVGFGPGIDTKTDPKAAAKPIQMQDYVFTNRNRVTKRNGYDAMTNLIAGGGSFTNPVMTKVYNGELLNASVVTGTSTFGQRMLGYSPALNRWIDKGKYSSIAVSRQSIAQGLFETNIGNSSSAIAGGYVLYAWDNLSSGITGVSTYTFISVQDTQSGSFLCQNVKVPGSGAGNSRAIALGSSVLAVFVGGYISVITVNTSGVTIGALTSVVPGSTIDAITTPTGCGVLCIGATLQIATLNTSGAVTHSASITPLGAVTPLSISLDSTTGNFWIYWIDSGSIFNYAIYSSTLSVVLATTSIISGPSSYQQIVAQPVSSTHQIVYYSQYTFPSLGNLPGSIYPSVGSYSVDNLGNSTSGSFQMDNVDIYSKIFTVGASTYIGGVFLSSVQATGFIIDVADMIVVSKFLPSEAEGIYGPNNGGSDGVQLGMRPKSSPATPNALTATDIIMACGRAISIQTTVFSSATPGAVYNADPTTSVVMGVDALSFDFDNIEANQGVIQQNTLVLNGGIVSQYDTASVTELGFSIYPDGMTGVVGTSGSIPAGTYIYYATYEWTDALGNLHQSAPSLPMTVVIGSGGAGSVGLKVQNLILTQKIDVNIVFWRTIAVASGGGVLAYRLATIQNVDALTSTVYTDKATDAAIQLSQKLYTLGESVLENLAPPPAMIIWTNFNRAWLIDSENPDTTIEYCKTASQGSGIAFSTGFLELIIDSKYGPITGASPMDEKTIILKQNGVGYFYGNGSDDSGNGSTISNFQFIPSDTGCVNSKSVILYPNGILFKSPKGIYQLSRGVSITYFGQDVEKYNSQDVQNAQLLNSKNQIRFLTSSGLSLVYDYVMNQWGTFTNHAGFSSDTFQGLYVYARSGNNAQDNNSIFIEDTSSFLDNATSFAPLVQIFFIKGQSIQNFERMRRIILLGDYQNGTNSGHGVQVSASYDFGTTFSAPIPYYFNTPTPFQYRERLPRQKCDTVSLLIQEITTGASGEFVDFTDLGFELGLKKGLNKLPGYRSVG
jgi:hypothetical protein